MIVNANGAELYVEEHGTGEPVLMLHGWPDSSARVRVGASRGSTPMTLTLRSNHAITPAINPPPPTGTMMLSNPPDCASNSIAMVPAPSMVER